MSALLFGASDWKSYGGYADHYEQDWEDSAWMLRLFLPKIAHMETASMCDTP